jgi:mitotic spindle assembly checkpoint protein MAD2
MASTTDIQTEINLKGSVDIVSEFFFTAINSILYQRGIYQPETFKRESKYGLTVLTSTDDGLLKYLSQVMTQVESWLLNGDVQRFVVVVSGVNSGETLERWQFNVLLDGNKNLGEENRNPNQSHKSRQNKSKKDIHGEIQAIIRQITASVTFLPLLNEPCAFDLLVYTKKEAKVPNKWEDSDPCYIMNCNEVKLRSFTTSIHKVDSMVAYREADEWEL